MIAWREKFASKVETPEQALRRVRNGDRVFVSGNAAVPASLVEALVARTDLEDVEIVHLLTFGPAPYTSPELQGRFRLNALFIGANTRAAVRDGRADYTPMHLHEIGKLFKRGTMRLDAALIQVSPPDEHGYCSYGVETNVVKPAAEGARIVIAEVNEQMPRALGDCFIHMRDIDAVVPADRPLVEIRQHESDEISQKIARHIADLVEDGATLQLGIGAIPDAVLTYLSARRDLGVHTEMFSDGILPLIEQGVITNAKKTLHRQKIVATFAFGTKKLYDFVHNNPMIEFRPSHYVNDPFVISQNDNLCAINSALEVDLTGQVCAESIGPMFYSGFGGQADFMRGAARSKNGKPIIALPSTARDGSISRIVPTLKEGAGVTTTRADVHYVVTEYGTAYLHGKSVRQRALALIQIAHPKFRPWLLAAAKAQNFVYPDQIEPDIFAPVYPLDAERHVALRDGSSVFIRPGQMTDIYAVIPAAAIAAARAAAAVPEGGLQERHGAGGDARQARRRADRGRGTLQPAARDGPGGSGVRDFGPVAGQGAGDGAVSGDHPAGEAERHSRTGGGGAAGELRHAAGVPQGRAPRAEPAGRQHLPYHD
jgi:4-hydroxybutyrate CoA-transferase